MKSKIIVGLILGTIVVALGLAAESGIIPFGEYRYKNPIFTFVFALINLPIVIAIPVTGVTSNTAIMAMFFTWWFIIGFFSTWIVQKIFAWRISRRINGS